MENICFCNYYLLILKKAGEGVFIRKLFFDSHF